MNSRPNVAGSTQAPSTENGEQIFSAFSGADSATGNQLALPGSLNDAAMLRGILITAIKRSNKSRARIAEEMSYFTGREVTERQLNGYTAESREDYRWPADLDRAFCAATGDNTLLECRAKSAGLHCIGDRDMQLLEFARNYFAQKRAAANVARLEDEITRGER